MMEKQFDQKLMLRCIVQDVLKNIWIAVAVAISAAFLAFMAAKIHYTPSYTSSATFIVSKGGGFSTAYTNMTQTQNLIDTFQTVVNSQLLQKKVCEDMGVANVPGQVTVTTIPETNLVTLSVTSPRPDQAFQMLKSVVKVYPEVGNKVLGEIILDVFEPPVLPDHPDTGFSGGHVMEMAFAFGFVLTAGLIALGFYLRDTVKTAEQAKSKLDTPLFATVYHEHRYKNPADFLKRRRKSMLLSDPAVSFLYEETIKKISTKLLYRLKSEQAQVVLITSTEAGEGVSTIAMNLAQDLTHRKKKVLLIEGDLKQPGLAKVLRVEKQKNIPSWGTYLKKNQNPDAAISKVGRYGFWTLLNDESIPQATELLASSHLHQWLKEWKQEADVILIDAPPVRHRSDTEVWARCADLSLLVVRQNQVEAKYINDSIDMLEEYGSGVVGCIYNDAIKDQEFVPFGYGHYGYGTYGNYYGSYGKYGKYGKNDRSDK